MRLWLKFARADSLAYISHLDSHKAYYRMFRRADLPLAYSQGFNPHPVMSLAAPLPLGFCSHADYIDLVLSKEIPELEIKHRLQSVTGHENLCLQGVRPITGKVPALASLIAWADYSIVLRQGGAQEVVELFNSAASLPFIKETKRGTREADAKQLVRELAATPTGLRAVLSLAEPVVFRPEECIQVLSGIYPNGELEIELVKREELYVRADNLVSPLCCAL